MEIKITDVQVLDAESKGWLLVIVCEDAESADDLYAWWHLPGELVVRASFYAVDTNLMLTIKNEKANLNMTLEPEMTLQSHPELSHLQDGTCKLLTTGYSLNGVMHFNNPIAIQVPWLGFGLN